MFNTYQELVDRINELLKIKKKQEKVIKALKNMYLKIPYEIIVQLEHDKIITNKDKEFWLRLDYLKRMEEKYVQNKNKNKIQ